MQPRRFTRKLLNIFTGTRALNPVAEVAQRFLQVFDDHGIAPAQIPRLLPQLDLAALKSEETLLAHLTPALLDATAKTFNIRLQWLEGIDDRIYESLSFYKRPDMLLEHLATIVAGKWRSDLDFPLRVLTTNKQLDRSGNQSSIMAPVLLEKIAVLGEESIYRYHVYQDRGDWSYHPFRIELKAIARIASKKLGFPIPLHAVTADEMKSITEGRAIPRRLLQGCLITDPSLEDYVLQNNESTVAKDLDELPEVMSFIAEHGLSEVKFHLADCSNLAEEKTDLPPLDFIPEKNGATPSTNVTERPIAEWTDQARSIADEFDAMDAACGAHDSLAGISIRVERSMRDRKIYGPRGPLSAGTIKREALQGGRWKRKT